MNFLIFTAEKDLCILHGRVFIMFAFAYANCLFSCAPAHIIVMKVIIHLENHFQKTTFSCYFSMPSNTHLIIGYFGNT